MAYEIDGKTSSMAKHHRSLFAGEADRSQNHLSTLGQKFRQYPGSSSSSFSLSTCSVSSPMATLIPPGQSNCKCKLGVSMISALTLPQSSQYHHLLPCDSQGGNGTQESHIQFGHGAVSPSPLSSMTVVIIIKMMLIMRPRNRVAICFTRAKQFSSMPKNAFGSLSIVLRPHNNP